MNTQNRFLSIMFLVVFSVSCGGGGGGGRGDGAGGGGDGGSSEVNAPTLLAVDFMQSEAAAGLLIKVTGSFTFSDPDGDLDGGTFNYTYEDTTYSFSLPAELSGVESGTVNFTVDAVLSSDPGTMIIPFWLIDKTGNQSNIVEGYFTQLWTRQFGSIYNDSGEAIAVDGDSNVYVTGNTKGDLDGNINLGSSDVFLTKYSYSSAKEWTKLIGSASDDYAKAVAVDYNDNVYITGYTLGDMFDGNASIGFSDFFVLKYDSTGNKLWSKLLGTVDSDEANGIAIDSNDNVYITGSTTGDLDGNINIFSYDVFLTRYNASGTRIWSKLLGSTESDQGNAVTIDSIDNIYVTGSTGGYLGTEPGNSEGGFDVFIAKYDVSGNTLWVTQIGTRCTEMANSICVDSNNNVYVTGRIWTPCAFSGNVANGLYDAFLVKVDSTGNIKWVKQFGTSEHDKGQAVTTDINDFVHVTGYLNSVYFTPDYDGKNIFLAKYNGLGERLWIVEENGGSNWYDQGKGLAIDFNSNIYLTGRTMGAFDGYTNYGENDVFIFKYDIEGTKQ